jgi:GDP-L-fucose synthase
LKNSSKIYVAGHTGLVGSALLRRLTASRFTNIITRTSSKIDLRRQEETERFLESERPEYIFLAAAKVGGIQANNTYKAEFIYDNISIATNVIKSTFKFGGKKLLNFGSSCIYPKLSPQPMKEECLLTGKLEPTNEPYAIAKIAAIKLCRYFNEQYGTNFISVMPTNLYGPYDNFNLETAHVLPALIRRFRLARLLSERRYEDIRKDIERSPLGFGNALDPRRESSKLSLEPDLLLKSFGISPDSVTLWGSGEPYREFLYVDDLADACVFLMNNCDYKDIGEFINIGFGEDIKIRDLASTVRKTVGFEGEISWDVTKPDGTPRKLLDVSKMRLLGWSPKIELKEGIKKTYQWYCSQLTAP